MNGIFALAAVAAVSLSVLFAQSGPAGNAAGATNTVHGFTVKDIDGKDVSLSKYRGEVLMIVNVASRCGYTAKSYAQMESLYQKYKEKGLRVLAFPANNFGSQEPGTNEEIKQFCANDVKVTFDLFAKISVMGEDQAPLYKFLTEHPDPTIAGPVQWNFQKYLVGRDGAVLAMYGTRTLPEDEKVVADIEKALAAPKPAEASGR